MGDKTDSVLPLETDGDKQTCIRCGSPALDTGWECNDCGFDSMPWYYPQGVKKLENRHE